jgi:hypothetical protein
MSGRIVWTTDSKGNRTATWVDDQPAAPKAKAKPPEASRAQVPGTGLLDIVTKDAPVLLEGSAKGISKGIETLQKTGDVGSALGAAGSAYMETIEKSQNPVPRVVMSGARDLVQNTLGNLPADIISARTSNPRLQNAPDANILGFIPPLPKVKLQGPGEEMASNIVQFALGWIPAAKGINLVGSLAAKVPGIAQGVQAARTAAAFTKGNKVAGVALKAGEIVTKGALTGSVVDFAVMDVDDGRLTDVVVQLNPTIRKFTEEVIGTPLELPYVNYLRSKPGDTAEEARWKNAVEGNFFVGPVFESVIWASGRFAKASSQYLKAIGQSTPAPKAVVDVTAQAVPNTAPKTPPAPKASKAEVAAAEVELKQAAVDLQEATARLATPEPPAPVARVVDDVPLVVAADAAPVFRIPEPPAAAAAPEFTARLDAAETKVTGLRQQLEGLGAEPPKPRSEKQRFGTKGKEGADPAAVARWEAENKAYNSWRRKYLQLKKQEVAASNEAFGLRQQADEAAAAVPTPPAAAAPEPSVPSAGTSATKAELPDTRGKGEFYHGAAKEFELSPGGEYSGDGMNIYGNGFYATEDLKTASAYQKKNSKAEPVVAMYGATDELRKAGASGEEINGLLGRGRSKPPAPERMQELSASLRSEAAQYPGTAPSGRMLQLADTLDSYRPVDPAAQRVVYRIKENQPVKFFDLDAPVTPDIRKRLRAAAGYDGAKELVDDSIGNLPTEASLAQIMDEIRAGSKSFDVPAYEVQEIFEDLIDSLKKDGYGGFTHVGGKLAAKGKRLHQVQIYWDPAENIALEKYDPGAPSAAAPSAPPAQAAGPSPAEIQELDQALAMGRADLSPEQRVALRDQVLAEKYGTGSPVEPPAATAMADEVPATAAGSDLPPVEPPRFTAEDESPEWAVKFAQQVAENLDNIKSGRVQIEDLLANNFQKFQSPSGNTKYVAQQPDLVAGYDAMSKVLPDRDVMTGRPPINKEEFKQLHQDWFARYGLPGDDILKGLEPVIKGFEEYQLGALHKAMVLADQKNMEAAMEGAMWVNSGAFEGVNVSERLARLVEAAAAAKRVNLAVMKVTRPWGQLGLEMQVNRDYVIPKTGNPDAPLVDIATQLKEAIEEGQGETLEQTILGKFHPDLAKAAKGGEITPEAQSAADALAEVLQDLHLDKKATPRFWETLDDLGENNVVETILALRTNNLISSGVTMTTNLMNGVANMPILAAQQVFGRGLMGDWRGMVNDLSMFQGFWMQLSGGFRMFGHSFKTGRSLTNLDRSTLDGLSKTAKQDAFSEAALEPKRSTSMINSFPLISDDLANTLMGKVGDWMWRTLGTPFSRMAVSIDTFNSTVSGHAYEHVRHLPRGMELAIERGMKEGSPEAWKWAQGYADARLKESIKSVVVDGRTLGEAALDSPHAKTFMDAVNFTDKLMAELQPRTPAEGIRLGQSQGLKGEELQAFAQNYLKEGTNIQKMAKLMLDGPVPLGRVGSIVPSGMTALAKAPLVGPIFRFIQPFVTVPMNIMKAVGRNTPAAPLIDTWWRDMASEDPGTKARAVGQMTTGTAFLAFMTLQMQLGNVRFNGGGPLDPRARNEWQTIQKRVPYSMQLPDGKGGWWEPISMRMFDPFSTLIGAIGDYGDLAGSLSDQEREKLGGALVWTLLTLQARNLLGKNYFQGANELYEAIFGSGQSDTGSKALERWQRYIARQVTTMLPGGSALRAARREIDPVARTTDVVDPDDVGGIVNAIFYQTLDEMRISIPGHSEGYPARLHPITGRPIVLSGIWGTEFIPEDKPWLAGLAQLAPWSPLQVGERVTDPVDMEMGRLAELGTSFSLPQASDFGAGMRLSRSELNQYIETFANVKMFGRTVHERLTETIQGDVYQSWPYEPKDSRGPSLRAAGLQEIISEYKELAKQQFLDTSAAGSKIQTRQAEIDRYKGVQDFTRRYGGTTAPRQPEGLR